MHLFKLSTRTRLARLRRRFLARDNLVTAVELLAVVVAFFATFFTYQSAVASKDSAMSAKEAADAAKQQVEAAQEQLDESKYQSAYEHQLALWQLAVEHKDSAPYILGGDKGTAGREAAYALTLDFYAYVYEELAPSVPGREYVPLELGGPNPGLPSLTQEQRTEWRTWSYTIAGGFRSVPALCGQLQQNRLAYSDSFHEAVTNAWVPETDSPEKSWIKLCPTGP